MVYCKIIGKREGNLSMMHKNNKKKKIKVLTEAGVDQQQHLDYLTQKEEVLLIFYSLLAPLMMKSTATSLDRL